MLKQLISSARLSVINSFENLLLIVTGNISLRLRGTPHALERLYLFKFIAKKDVIQYVIVNI